MGPQPNHECRLMSIPFGMFIDAGFGGIASRCAFVAWSAMLATDITLVGLGP